MEGAETVIKGMHSIKKNPITFCIREIKFISVVGQGQSLWEKCRKGRSGNGAKRLLSSISTIQNVLMLLPQEDY